MAESSMPKRSEDDCDMVTSLQEPFLSKAELALHEAARTNQRSEVERLVKLVRPDCRNSLDRTALHMAASKGHRSVVVTLIENKAAVELTDKYGMSPLMWATYFGHVDVVVALIDRGANVKRRNKLGMHALHIAAEQNRSELVSLFLSKTKRTVLDDTEKNGQTAIMLAAAKGNLDVVKCLISCEADVRIRDSKKRSVLHLAAASECEVSATRAEVVRELLTSGNRARDLLNEKDEQDRTAIHYAVERGCIETVACLLKYGASLNRTGELDESSVQPADADAPPKKLVSPFHLAAMHGFTEILQLLAEQGAEVNAANSSGNTALHYAALNDNADEVCLLVHLGCDVAVKNTRLQTPLHLAAEQNKINAAEALLLSGAPLNLSDKTGKTPLVLATRGSCVCIVDMIIKAERHRAKLERFTLNKPAPWDAAARASHLDAAAVFKPDGYENCENINKVNSMDDEQTVKIIRDTGQMPQFMLREFNQPYAEEFKLFLWKLAFKHLRFDEWKLLAAFWHVRVDHVQAIEHQYSDENSYKQHCYRLLCIWFHGLGRDTPIRELYEALVHIGRRPLAVKVRQKLDRSVQYFSAAKYHNQDGKRCALQ